MEHELRPILMKRVEHEGLVESLIEAICLQVKVKFYIFPLHPPVAAIYLRMIWSSQSSFDTKN